MFRLILRLSALFCLTASSALASNIYTVSYEGNDMPESEPGWFRYYTGGGGATRYIESDGQGNNHLVIDSYSNWHVSDYADYYRQMDPDGPNERFFCEWRVLISATHANADHGLTIAADDMHMINYGYLMNAIWDGFDGWTAPITPGVFHTYRIESADMVSYRLYIDGSLARVASWFEGLAHGYAGFGDEALGGQTGSTSSWDYFRFGVYEVPEPFSALLIVGMCVCGGRRRV